MSNVWPMACVGKGIDEDSRLAVSGAFEPNLLLLALATRQVGGEVLVVADNLDAQALHNVLWRARPARLCVGSAGAATRLTQGQSLLDFDQLLGPVETPQRLRLGVFGAQWWSEEGTEWQAGLTVLFEQWLSRGHTLAFPESPGSASRDRREVAPSGLLSAGRCTCWPLRSTAVSPRRAPGADVCATGPLPIRKAVRNA